MLNSEICFFFALFIRSPLAPLRRHRPVGKFLKQKMNAHAPDYSEIDPDFMEEVIFINSAADYVLNYDHIRSVD